MRLVGPEQLINASGPAVLVENCHQGGLAPGARAWQTYIKNSSVNTGYSHLLGYPCAGASWRGGMGSTILVG